jgi:hypothetical protein
MTQGSQDLSDYRRKASWAVGMRDFVSIQLYLEGDHRLFP